MTFQELDIKGVWLITPELFEDDRGAFFRYYCKKEFSKITSSEFVQMNHSINLKKGTLRGMHYQRAPFSEEKIISCIKGIVLDVFVDLRKDSPTFLQWSSVELSDKNNKLIYLPAGIAHGFITLEDDSHLIYHHSEFYTPGYETGLKFDDPILGIKWPFRPTVISNRDAEHPLLTNDFKGI